MLPQNLVLASKVLAALIIVVPVFVPGADAVGYCLMLLDVSTLVRNGGTLLFQAVADVVTRPGWRYGVATNFTLGSDESEQVSGRHHSSGLLAHRDNRGCVPVGPQQRDAVFNRHTLGVVGRFLDQ
jgi:hypothetical protein